MLFESGKAQGGRSRVVSRRFAWAMLAVLLAAPALAAPQQPATDAPKEPPMAKKVRGRLPAHYGRVVSSQQRETIYKLQANYAAKIAELKKQITALMSDRDKEVEAVLTADQRRQVNKLREDARVAREARAAAKAKAAAKSESDAGKSDADGSR